MALCLTFFFRMSLFTYLSIMSSIKRMLPTPLAGIHPQINIEFTYITELNFLHTLVIPSEPNRLFFVSSDQITSFQNFWFLFRWSSANRTLSSRLISNHEGYFLESSPWMPYSCNTRRIVWLHIVFLIVFLTDPRSFVAVSIEFVFVFY